MTAAERILQTVHNAGHALVVICDEAIYNFADAADQPLPDWLHGEICAYIPELVELCRDAPCARCGRPEMVPLTGMQCSSCDQIGPLGQPPQRPGAHA
jgi:hypothetical protein